MSRKREHILGLTATHCIDNLKLQEGITRTTMTEFLHDVSQHIVIRERESLEKDPSCLHLIPYVVVHKGDLTDPKARVLTYQRAKGVGETRLLGNHSIGFGGHIDFSDIKHVRSQIDLLATVRDNAVREVFDEELKITVDGVRMLDVEPGQLKFVGLLRDTSNEVGTVHLGVIFTVLVPENAVFEANESSLPITGEFELQALGAPDFNHENWTKILIQHLLSDQQQAQALNV